ncbi:hypothetical protein FQR65_LT07112 [Abscondita terminalis]|nr:hypothetical protein FQR65_LT07112 [Abscondita terminalis]
MIKSPMLHYLVTFEGKHHYLDLWPNHNLISTDMVFESRNPNEKVKERRIKRKDNGLCYYHGRIRDKPESRVALSTCYGLAGYIILDGRRYFIEPAAEYEPNIKGQQPHLIYKAQEKEKRSVDSNCGTSSNWQEAWKNRFFDEYTKNPVYSRSTLVSVPRHLETLVVADKKFLEHHKNTDYDSYVMTIMNMVSDFYHDASAGHQLNVVVVRVMYLEKEEEEIDLAINANAEDTLASFCKWQQSVNPKDVNHPNHHDIAILLTRYDICADSMTNCGLLGLAYVASACNSEKSCAINEDGGLILGVVVTHEMGHIMGCSHDIVEESGCKPKASDDSYYVMSPFVHIYSKEWSTCSKIFMNELFDNNLGECLNNQPQDSIYKETGMLPGAMYDGKYQCNMIFPGSDLCSVSPQKFCKQLMCQDSPTSCVTNTEPPADGTRCGENKVIYFILNTFVNSIIFIVQWCYNTKCIEVGSRPEAINGEWGEWGAWSKCSRTCGAGVSYSERQCNNPPPKHRGRYCLGERKRIKICNTLACPEIGKRFREKQCSEFNQIPFRGKLYTWEPYTKDDAPCALYCINDKRIYAKLAPRAKDGTKCKPGTKNMCISGVCRKVGCDFAIDSDAMEDRCGICKGDGSQCELIDEVYHDVPGHGYVKITTINKGSRNIYVEEQAPSDNTIALSATDEKRFYLNGDFKEQQDGIHSIGGAEGIYSHPEPNKESLVIYGPLKEDVVLFVVFYGNENVGYSYKYSEPASQNYPPQYHWEFAEWGECSVRCGGGTETSDPDCIEARAGKVSPTFCQGLEKPHPLVRECNADPCKTKWRVGKWSNCTACKFQSGVRVREVECIKEAKIPGEDDVLEEDDKCPSPKPGTRELCNSRKTCSKSKTKSKSKNKREGFSPDVMRHLWLQTMPEYMHHEPISYQDAITKPHKMRKIQRDIMKYRAQKACTPNANSTLKVGTVVGDRLRPEDIELIEIPIKQSHMSINLTDEAFEHVGDQMADTLDIDQETIYLGQEAVSKLKELQHANTTAGG